MVFKKIVNFLCCFIVWIQDFIKKLRYLKSKISTKFHHLLFLFYFFNIFGILFSISQLRNLLWCFIGRVRDFTNNFWKFLKVLLKKILICEIFFFSKFCSLLFVFFFDILFSISSISTCQKILEIFMFFFILWIRDFIKEFWKIVECFSKKSRHLKSKILHKFHRLVFVFFYSFSILVIFFFLFHLFKLVKKF